MVRIMFNESEKVEIKFQVTADICKEVIGFDNSNDETIYIGVEDNGNIVGVINEDKVILQ